MSLRQYSLVISVKIDIRQPRGEHPALDLPPEFKSYEQ